MTWRNFPLFIPAFVTEFAPIRFPREMISLNGTFIKGLFVPLADSTGYCNRDPEFYQLNPTQRDAGRLFVTLVTDNNDLTFERVPLSYFSNSGRDGTGIVGEGNRCAKNMELPAVNQVIRWDQSFLEAFNPITSAISVQFILQW